MVIKEFQRRGYMALRKKKKQDKFEYFYRQIEEWSRSYHFGIDYSYGAAPDGPPWEWNEVSFYC